MSATTIKVMDREAIYRDTIGLQWVQDYLENTMKTLAYHNLLCGTHSDKPTRSWRYQHFLYSLPLIKLYWDHQTESFKQETLRTLDKRIQELHEASAEEFSYNYLKMQIDV